MNISKILSIVLAVIFLTGCSKKDFTIDGEIKDAGTMNLRLIYYSSTGSKGTIQETAIPVVNGKFNFNGTSERPTVVWIFSPNQSLLTPVYVEPGDEIKISGEYNKPYEWNVAGNETEEDWCEWRKKNAKTLLSKNDKIINTEIGKYVRANRDNPVSALNLLCFYVKRDNMADYDKLWKLLSEEARQKDIVNAVEAAANHQSAQAYTIKVPPLRLYSYADSIETINPMKAKSTFLYFWRQREEQHDSCMSNIKRLHAEFSDSSKLQIVDINMDSDTLKWRRQARRDSVDQWQHYWAIGGEINLSLARLEIARTPYIIVVDSVGNQRYRGDNFSKAEKVVNDMLKKK